MKTIKLKDINDCECILFVSHIILLKEINPGEISIKMSNNSSVITDLSMNDILNLING
jgi:competence transcription factor ComK